MNKKLIVINRHCAFSTVSAGKARPHWFSRERCFDSLQSPQIDKFVVMFDEARGSIKDHFLPERFNKISNDKELILFRNGTEGGAFCEVLDYIVSLSVNENDIIYVVEDDYLHLNNYVGGLLEGADAAQQVSEYGFWTGYAHADKYDKDVYPNLKVQILHTQSLFWQTTPSTTNTYAGNLKSWKHFYELQRSFSHNHLISRDHDKFIAIWKSGGALVSAIPPFSTHCEPAYLSPTIPWENFA